MNEMIDSFSHIIESYTVLKERENPKISELKIRIFFTDHSLLEYSEINVMQPPKRKYSFQWMKADYQLLARRDNEVTLFGEFAFCLQTILEEEGILPEG